MIDLPAPPPPWELPLPPAVGMTASTSCAVSASCRRWASGRCAWTCTCPAVGPAPAVIFIHGGAWLFGDRDGVGPMYMTMVPDVFTALAQRGIAVVSVDYRMTGGGALPGAAARRGRRPPVRRRPGRRAGHRRLPAGRLGRVRRRPPRDAARLLPGGCRGPGDQRGRRRLPASGRRSSTGTASADIRLPMGEALMPGPTPGGAPRRRTRSTSTRPWPRRRRRSRTCQPVRRPTLVVHGTGDTLIPVERSQEVVAALRGAGVDVEALWIDGAQHAWLGSPAAADQALDATVAFLQRRLG